MADPHYEMKPITISLRGRLAPASPIRKLTPLAEVAKERDVVVHHLNIGQPDFAAPAPMLEAYRQYQEPNIPYAPSDGYRRYRDRLSRYYTEVSREGGGSSVGPDDIVITTGGSEALLFAIAATCDPGEEILVCEPFYTNYAAFAHILGVDVRAVTCYAREGFRVDPARIDAAVGERTRALCLSTPGNPTGVVLSQTELKALAEICRRRGLFFLCDEVYRELVYDDAFAGRAPSLVSLQDFEQHAVVIDSVSKRYSACGARIGALVTRNCFVREAALRFAQARLSPATVDQWAALAALDTGAGYFREVVAEYRARRDALVAGLRGIGIDCITPQGAFYLVAPLPIDDADRFCRFLLESFSLGDETVMLAPGSGFYATPGLGKNEVRIAYVLDIEKLQRCVRILAAALEAYSRKA